MNALTIASKEQFFQHWTKLSLKKNSEKTEAKKISEFAKHALCSHSS